MQKPLWAIKSGKWIGWNIDDIVYDVSRKDIGKIINNRIYSLNGTCIGELVFDKYVGINPNSTYPTFAPAAPFASIRVMKCGDITGLSNTPLNDPEF